MSLVAVKLGPEASHGRVGVEMLLSYFILRG